MHEQDIYGIGVELARKRLEAELMVVGRLLLDPIRTLPVARRTGVTTGIYRTPSCKRITGGMFAEPDLALIAAASMHVGASGRDFPVSARVARLALLRARMWTRKGIERGPDLWSWSGLMRLAFSANEPTVDFESACTWLVDLSERTDRAGHLMRQAVDAMRGGVVRPMRIAKAVA